MRFRDEVKKKHENLYVPYGDFTANGVVYFHYKAFLKSLMAFTNTSCIFPPLRRSLKRLIFVLLEI